MVDHKTGRNDPCPCGSGLKYKNCHLGRPDDTPEVVRRRVVGPMIVGGVGLLGAIGAGVWRGPGTGLTFAAAAALILGMYVILRNPPAGDPKRKDSGSINFGG
jgi:hypothetical protein